MNALVEFLRARIDERERIALAGAKYLGKDWHASPGKTAAEDQWTVWDDAGANCIGMYCQMNGEMRREEAVFIADNDPRSVLRQVKAMRDIVAEHALVPAGYRGIGLTGEFGCRTCHCHEYGTDPEGTCPTLRSVAAFYADHPDYRPEWATS